VRVSVCALAVAVSRLSMLVLVLVLVRAAMAVVVGVTPWSGEAVGTLGMGALGHRRQGYAH
jgi:hypothetical protein